MGLTGSAAPEPSPACAPTSPLPARPTPAPTSPSSTPSNTDEPCTQYQGVSGGLDSDAASIVVDQRIGGVPARGHLAAGLSGGPRPREGFDVGGHDLRHHRGAEHVGFVVAAHPHAAARQLLRHDA